jgi:hypothetical protein
MSELKKSYITDANLGPVKLAALERPGGGIEAFEVSFRERSLDTRDSRFVHFLKGIVIVACIVPFFWFTVRSPFIVFYLMNGTFLSEVRSTLWAAPGAIVFLLVFVSLLTALRRVVRVVMTPGRDELAIYIGKRLRATVKLSEVRGVSIESHPGLDDAIAAAQARPSKSALNKLNHYRETEVIFLIIGQAVATYKVEVAAFRGKAAWRQNITMRVRAGLELAWRMATAGFGGELTAQREAIKSESTEVSVVRRRRGRLELE